MRFPLPLQNRGMCTVSRGALHSRSLELREIAQNGFGATVSSARAVAKASFPLLDMSSGKAPKCRFKERLQSHQLLHSKSPGRQ